MPQSVPHKSPAIARRILVFEGAILGTASRAAVAETSLVTSPCAEVQVFAVVGRLQFSL